MKLGGILSDDEVDLFYDIYLHLLFYINEKLRIMKQFSSYERDFKKFIEYPKEKIVSIRDAMYDNHLDLMLEYIKKNPYNVSKEHLKIIKEWYAHFIKDNFIIFRYEKDYTLFYRQKTSRVYAVVALHDPLPLVVGPDLPKFVEAVLLPFKGKIIYDGILYYMRVIFGKNIKKSILTEAEEAIVKYGVIKSIPEPEHKVVQVDDENLLKFYLKNKYNRERYAEEIEKLIRKNKRLLAIYYQEIGKQNARKYKKVFNELGIHDAWFAIIGATIIASGKTKEQVSSIVNAILPKEKQSYVYFFYKK